jgi:hypothetical protein
MIVFSKLLAHAQPLPTSRSMSYFVQWHEAVVVRTPL